MFRRPGSSGLLRQRARRRRHFCETLEERALLATLTVTNLNDAGPGSLRAAVEASNATAINDTIDLSGVAGTIALTSELSLTDGVTILGPGAGQLTISGNHASRVFSVGLAGGNGEPFAIQDITIADGSGDGGAIKMVNNRDSLELVRSIVRDNMGTSLQLAGSFQVRESSIINNSAEFGGSAMEIGSFADGWIVNSTISGNAAGNGLGVITQVSSDNHVNVTRLINVTIAGNNGGGIDNFSFAPATGTIEITNSVLADNSGPNLQSGGTGNTGVVSGGNNVADDSGGGFLNGPGDLIDTDARIDPILADNGGGVPTHALLSGSPAIDHGNNAKAVDRSGGVLVTDVRGTGFARLVDGDGDGTATVDSGAFEAPPVATTVSGQLQPTVSADIDRDGEFRVATDGTLAIRSMAGFIGEALTSAATDPGGTRTDAGDIGDFLSSGVMRAFLDLDGDGDVRPLSDGILFLRALDGATGQALVQGAVSESSSRSASEILALIDAYKNFGDVAYVPAGTVFQVAAENGLTSNDPPGATVIASDTTSLRGAGVHVANDGSFTYDTSEVPALRDLAPFAVVDDSFEYTIQFAGQTQTVPVTIHVLGPRGSGSTFLQTDEDTKIEMQSGRSLLESSDNPRVTAHDEISELGATVEVLANGQYSYDPRGVAIFDRIAAGDQQIDSFEFTYETNSSGPQTVHRVLGEFDQAALCHLQSLRLIGPVGSHAPAEQASWIRAAMWAGLGDEQSHYDEIRGEVINRFAGDRAGGFELALALASLLSAAEPPLLQQVQTWLTSAAPAAPAADPATETGNGEAPVTGAYGSGTLAVAHALLQYRMGNHAPALQIATGGIDRESNDDRYQILLRLIASLCHHRLDQPDAATELVAGITPALIDRCETDGISRQVQDSHLQATFLGTFNDYRADQLDWVICQRLWKEWSRVQP